MVGTDFFLIKAASGDLKLDRSPKTSWGTDPQFSRNEEGIGITSRAAVTPRGHVMEEEHTTVRGYA